MMFAQADLANIPAETFKWIFYTLVALLLVAAVIIGIIKSFGKNKTEIEGQPIDVRKSPKRYNHDLAEARHDELDRRIKVLEEVTAKTADSISAMHTQLMTAGEERALRLGARLDPLIVNTAEMKGRMEAFNESIRLFTNLAQRKELS